MTQGEHIHRTHDLFGTPRCVECQALVAATHRPNTVLLGVARDLALLGAISSDAGFHLHAPTR